MVVDEKPINFSTEDPSNVCIPDSLGPIAYEFFPNYIFLLKGKNLVGIDQTLEIFRNIARFNKDFFKNGHRFCQEIWPYLKLFLENNGVDFDHYLKNKIIRKIFEFIEDICVFHDEEFRSSCCLKAKEGIIKQNEKFKLKS